MHVFRVTSDGVGNRYAMPFEKFPLLRGRFIVSADVLLVFCCFILILVCLQHELLSTATHCQCGLKRYAET